MGAGTRYVQDAKKLSTVPEKGLAEVQILLDKANRGVISI